MAERILVAMSGGVDSSVTAALLQEQGFDVTGARMRVWGASAHESSESPRPCCSSRDLDDARAVAAQLGISFHVFDLRREFEQAVVTPFVLEYLRGQTPNPCVRCNPALKLGVLLDKAKALGCAALATGHYVRIEQRESGRWGIRRGHEPNREQSYYLHRLSQEQLAQFRAPLGTWTKNEVRDYAQKRGLRVAEKPGSQEICFIPDNDYREFVRQHPLAARSSIQPGEIVDRHGRVLGRHSGIVNHTIGQRRGLGIAHSCPLYVIGLDPESNRVIVGEKDEVYARSFIAAEVNWVSVDPPGNPFDSCVQIRYRHKASPARVEPVAADRVRIEFADPQPAITPGQAAVFYDSNDDWIVGGGWIEKENP